MTRYGIVCVGNQMISSEFGINKKEKIFSKTNKIALRARAIRGLWKKIYKYLQIARENHVITY